MKKEMIFAIALIIISIGILTVSAGKYTYLKAYYDSLDDECTLDSDCAIKNVENCCGYYPICLNKATVLVPEEVLDICLNEKKPDCKAIYNVAYCRCQKLSGKTTRKCVGNTGRPIFSCGDGNCFLDETNVTSPNFCKKDCVAGSNDEVKEINYQTCEKDSDCLSVDGGCCSCVHSGNATAINRVYLNAWDKNLIKQCKGTLCADVISNDPSCSKKARCIDNRCTLEEKVCPMIKLIGCPDKTEIVFVNDSNGCRNGRKCLMKLNNGKNSEVKIMPESASTKAIERLGELGFDITLKETGTKDKEKLIYELTAEKSGKFLGLIKVKAKVSAEVDAENGEVLKIKKPWWGFLAGI